MPLLFHSVAQYQMLYFKKSKVDVFLTLKGDVEENYEKGSEMLGNHQFNMFQIN